MPSLSLSVILAPAPSGIITRVTHSPRILIFYAEAGAGHRRAAEAMAQPLAERGAAVSLIDAMRFTHPLFRAVYVGGGLGLITRLPRLYRSGLSPQRSARDRSGAARTALSLAADQHARALPHDRILSTRRDHLHAFSARRIVRGLAAQRPAARAGVHRRHRFRSAFHVAARRHRSVLRPDDEARARLIRRWDRSGDRRRDRHPDRSGFAALPDRSSAARRVHLDPDRAVVLIMGGGLGVGAMEAVARSLLAHPLDAQFVFITGSNHALRRRLKAMSKTWIVRGFVNNMPDWLAAADVAISKAGGLAGSELLAAGVPTIIPWALDGPRGHERAATWRRPARRCSSIRRTKRSRRPIGCCTIRTRALPCGARHCKPLAPTPPHSSPIASSSQRARRLVTHYSLRTMWTIRRYQPSDRSAVRQLAGDTAHFGDPIERFFDAREVFLDAFATFYTDVAYNYLWVAEEDGALLGYIMGCPDTHDYNEWFRTQRQAGGVARGHPALSWRVHAQVAGLHLALCAAAHAVRRSLALPGASAHQHARRSTRQRHRHRLDEDLPRSTPQRKCPRCSPGNQQREQDRRAVVRKTGLPTAAKHAHRCVSAQRGALRGFCCCMRCGWGNRASLPHPAAP